MSEGFIPAGEGGWPFASRAAAFRSDSRFSPLPEGLAAADQAPAPVADAEPHDPIAAAFAEGYAAGAADAQAHAEQLARGEAAARAGLELSITRLDRELEEQLRQRLRDTVAALCEAAIAPMALDETALMARIERAVSMLSRADDDRLIRLHPDDIPLLSSGFAAEWQVLPDRTLDRGAIRVETASGGVEDGPELWRRAIAEALHQC